MTWQTEQPARVKISMMGSSPVTNGIVSDVSVEGAKWLAFGLEAGGSRRAQTAESKTRLIATQTTHLSRVRASVPGADDEESVVRPVSSGTQLSLN